MQPRRIRVHLSYVLWILILFVCSLSSAVQASDLQIVQREDAYVGQEITLSLQSAAPLQKNTYEWQISGDVKPVLLKNGGMECAFTPINTSPIDIEVVARENGGQVAGSATLALVPRYFDVKIEKLEEEPLMIWDIQTKGTL